jgi:hypothetical protein
VREASEVKEEAFFFARTPSASVKGVRAKKNAWEQGRGAATWESGVLRYCS